MGYDIPSDHSTGPTREKRKWNSCPTHTCELDDNDRCPQCEEGAVPVRRKDSPATGGAGAQAKRDSRWDGSLPRLVRATALLLADIDPEPGRAGLVETPLRVAKAWQFWTSGYHLDPADVLKVFEDGAEQCDEMVVRKHVPIYSHCEHHLAPIIGEAIIAYIPDGKIVGLSKLDRLADIFARRLQVQERMTNQIAEALQTHLAPAGCGVVIKARHMCMESRGVCHQNSQTTTSALRGVFKDDARVRAEFLSLAYNGD